MNHEHAHMHERLVETPKCNIYTKEKIEEVMEVYTVTACKCACTHAWHLACMHAHACMCVYICAYIHAHVTCVRMHACL